MIDIDCFKKYNDHYGHTLGDDSLRSVAKALKKSIKRPADDVARYGGEEFVVILPDTGKSAAIDIAEKLRENVELLKIPHKYNECNDHVTISLGVQTVIPQKDMDAISLLKATDQCLYQAKESGRNQVNGALALNKTQAERLIN